ncbi:DNA repair protein RecN [Paracidovorax valerianellae]|uniref:DNA repair protein RecN n=1 Tax=Paracidovorax valerianellae TaxID=187868 RepID=A0A1G6NUH6_9BURK|nr:DNA repair protein RecN [Paracidovorax valerianellae]MDA8444631.1 DNA repair protein RecN [Paracidovorax valerianellae]SDC70805.1 DNA replication and repair protein RecN [Paracidovorax valerianellae]
MALKRIALRDFVIVDMLELDLQKGFTVLTGETGAGKSILIDALQMLLGARADSGVIREGSERTDICAEFDSPSSLASWLEEAGIPLEDGLLLRRTIDRQGKSRAWMNGIPVTATQMRTVGGHLLDIHGQHAWQSLMRQDAVRSLLDAYGGISTAALEPLWNRWRDDRRALAQAEATQHTLQQERERLQWQINEVQKLAPAPNEWDELNTQHSRLSHAQALLDSAQKALSTLENEDSGARSQLSLACHLLQEQQHLDPEFQSVAEVLQSCMDQAADAAHSLQGYLRHIELDPDRLLELDSRMSLWVSLSRKYKRTPADLPVLLDGWKAELAKLDTAADLESLGKAERASNAAYAQAALVVSRQRAESAPLLAQSITQAMQGLGMVGGRFEVLMETTQEPGIHGVDSVSFLVAGHPGATPRPVGKVASGGELSRISLAISVTTSQLGQAPTLIFDEVDSGVGGSVAETVGRLMQQLGRDRQVLAVTHLPQVAACADHHLIVAKTTQGDNTTSQVVAAKGDQRVTEMARMLGGERQSRATMAHAREMLSSNKPVQGKA